MASPTLVIADYPIGYASGFGETLYNLFDGFPIEKLWTAHPSHISPADDKRRAQSIKLPSPSRPDWMPNRISLAYYPFLKAQQFNASRHAVRLLSEVVEKNSIRNILAVPVTPWILSAALAVHKQHPSLNLVVYVMDDWQGHHECHQLPYHALAAALAPRSDRSLPVYGSQSLVRWRHTTKRLMERVGWLRTTASGKTRSDSKPATE